MSQLSAYDSHALLKGSGGEWTMVDVRTSSEYSRSHIVGAVNVPFMREDGRPNKLFLAQMTSKFDKKAKIIVCSSSGLRSSRAVVRLAAAGWSTLCDLQGGHASWRTCQLPMCKFAA